MSRQIDITKPLSDEDRYYLEVRGRHDEIAFADTQGASAEMTPEEQGEAEQQAIIEAKGKRTPALVDNSVVPEQIEQREDLETAQLEVSSQQFDPDDVAYVGSLKVDELQEALRGRGKLSSGNKPELQNRLLEALKAEDAEDADDE
jgi:hypothetical protein